MEHYFVDANGKYLGTHAGLQRPDELLLDDGGAEVLVDGKPVVKTVFPYEPPAGAPPGAIEVSFPPADGRDVWDGEKYIPHVESAPTPDLATLISVLIKKGAISEADVAAGMNAKRKPG